MTNLLAQAIDCDDPDATSSATAMSNVKRHHLCQEHLLITNAT